MRGFVIGTAKYVGALIVLFAFVALVHSFVPHRQLTVCAPDNGMDYRCTP